MPSCCSPAPPAAAPPRTREGARRARGPTEPQPDRRNTQAHTQVRGPHTGGLCHVVGQEWQQQAGTDTQHQVSMTPATSTAAVTQDRSQSAPALPHALLAVQTPPYPPDKCHTLTFSSSTHGTGRCSSRALASRRNTCFTRPVDCVWGSSKEAEGHHGQGAQHQKGHATAGNTWPGLQGYPHPRTHTAGQLTPTQLLLQGGSIQRTSGGHGCSAKPWLWPARLRHLLLCYSVTSNRHSWSLCFMSGQSSHSLVRPAPGAGLPC